MKQAGDSRSDAWRCRWGGGWNRLASIAFMGLLLNFQSIELYAAASSAPFRFADLNERSLGLWEGEQPVFVYNHGPISKSEMPRERSRSTYLHPIYGLDGEILTDDFPKDHPYHRGLFWGWPHIRVGQHDVGLWALNGIEQRFERWITKESDQTRAELGVENGWYIQDKKVARERLRFRAHPSTDAGRAIDVEIEWNPVDRPITLQGAEGKSYGGFTLRFAPRADTRITTPVGGQTKEDLLVTRMPWADFSARFNGRSSFSGAAIFVAPDHPGFPPEWMTRHYGLLCVGWPGVHAKTFQPAESFRLRYRLWIHRGEPDGNALQKMYEAFARSAKD